MAVAYDSIVISQRTDSDCLRCCIANVLGLKYADVPDFVVDAGGHWFDHLWRWAHDRGIRALRLRCTSDGGEMLPDADARTAWWIATGPTERGTNHAVVMQGDLLVHDPHESRAGLLSITGALLLWPSLSSALAAIPMGATPPGEAGPC